MTRPLVSPDPATLRRAIEERTARCVVIGLGHVGRALAGALAEAGFPVHGYDRDPAAVDRCRGRAPAERPEARWSAGTSDEVLADADVVVVAVRLPVADGGRVDHEPLRSVASALRAHPRLPRLVLLVSTVPPGTTRAFAAEWLDAGAGCHVAHAPERLAAEHGWRDLRRIPHLVGGTDAGSTALASLLLRSLCDEVVPVSAPEVSELSKLLENTFRTVNIALVGEVTRIAHAFGVCGSEVCRAAATKPFGYLAFHPGAGVGGHCLPNDLQILRHAAAAQERETPLLDAAALSAARLPAVAVERLEALLAATGRPLQGSAVLLVGVGFKPGSPDTTASPAHAVVRLLRARGARPAYLDSQVPAFAVDGEPVPHAAAPDDSFAAALLLAGDPGLAAERLAGIPVVLDAGGGRILAGAPTPAHAL
jgi:UDP-N-acetyl-D-glucosamine dehydrogenase